MSDLTSFNEATFFSFVDNPAVACLKDAEGIKEEYKETPVLFFPRNLRIGGLLEDGGSQEDVLALQEGPRYAMRQDYPRSRRQLLLPRIHLRLH